MWFNLILLSPLYKRGNRQIQTQQAGSGVLFLNSILNCLSSWKELFTLWQNQITKQLLLWPTDFAKGSLQIPRQRDAFVFQDDPYLFGPIHKAFPMLWGDVLLQVLFPQNPTHGALQGLGPFVQLLLRLLHLCHDLPRTEGKKWEGSIIVPQSQFLPWGKSKLRQE